MQYGVFVKAVSIYLTLLIAAFCSTQTAAQPAPHTLTVPKFHCELPKYRHSGDGSRQVRQLERIEKLHKRCVKVFKQQLRESQQLILSVQAQTTDKTLLIDIAQALALIEKLLVADFRIKQFGAPAHPRDFPTEFDSGIYTS